ncbi:MAG: transcription antitermination factor NusB [Gudongella sp.]|nr:transcription antitermination factor NusB [Gudongella sp.]
MGRKQAREGAMQLLFQMDSNCVFDVLAIDSYLENFPFGENESGYIRSTVSGILENKSQIDEYITNQLDGWSLERLAKVDLATLRVAIYEILYMDDIPVEVSINEAIEMVKKFSASDAYKYVNGVLGGFVRAIDKK